MIYFKRNTKLDSSISWISSCNHRKSINERFFKDNSSSRHLPASLVASFVKRLARLGLLIPQHDQCLILTFIYNLILRHPTVRVLIDRQDEQSSMNDKYSSEERDPNKTNAIDSSLWEVEVNENHSISIESK